MELILWIIFLVLCIPVVVGFCGGFATNTMTVDRSPSMKSFKDDEDIFDSEYETNEWRPASLSQPSVAANTAPTPFIPEVSSLPPEVENSLNQLMGAMGVDLKGPEPIVSELDDQNQYDGPPELPNEVEHDIDRMLENITDSDVPPPEPDNLIEFPGQHSPLPIHEYNAIRRTYGPAFADQITTTPSLGASNNEVDVMMGRVSISSEGTILLTYNKTSIPIRGVGITEDLDGVVVLVKGFFIESGVFMVEDTVLERTARQEVL